MGSVKETKEREGKLAVTWCKDNFLIANTDKFQAMLTDPCRLNERDTKCDLMIQGATIDSSDHISLFAVDIDRNLLFKNHIGKICKKARKRVAVITHFCNLVLIKVKLQIY